MVSDEPELRPWSDATRPPSVAAIIVTRNGGRWLPEMIASLSSMEIAPTCWRVVDVASTDESADIIRPAFGEALSFLPSGTGFGAAVSSAVENCPDTDWLWLLHDDMVVRYDTLAELLAAAIVDDDIAAVGPKIREWPSLRRLLEVGLTITGTAHRETGLETGEPDAGQHDRPGDVLAVGSAGILIRRSVWNELGGFDPELPLYFDDIDFGWRANKAGHRVRTAPAAVGFHAEASSRDARSAGAGAVPPSERRRAGLYTALVNTMGASFWWQYIRLLCGSLLRTLGFVLVKDFAQARHEIAAVTDVYGRPGRLLRARRQRPRPSREDAHRIRTLLPPIWLPYARGVEAVIGAVTAAVRPDNVVSGGRRSAGTDAAYRVAQPTTQRRWWVAYPWATTVAVLIVASAIAARELWAGGPLHGGALPMSPADFGHWWGIFFSRWHDVGLASDVTGPAYALIMAVAALPVWFSPGALTGILVVFSVPLAALTAHRFARVLVQNRLVRIGWSITYGTVLVASGAVVQGRLGTLVAAILLPVIAGAIVRMVQRPQWQAGIAAGIWVAVATAFAPVVYPLVIITLAAIGLARVVPRLMSGQPGQSDQSGSAGQSESPGRRHRTGWLFLLPVLVPWPLLGPWMLQRVLRPFQWWWEAGFPVSGQATVLDVLTGRGGGPGSAPGWLSVGVILAAVLALAPLRNRRLIALAWLVAILGLATALWGMTTNYTPSSTQLARAAWVGLPGVLWLGGLSAAVALAADQWERPSRKQFLAVTAMVVLLPVGVGVWAIGRGIDGPVHRGDVTTVPVYVAGQPGAALVLSGSVDDGLDMDVVRGSGPVIGEEAVLPPASTLDPVRADVQQLLAGTGSSGVADLAERGISSIYAPDADAQIARQLDAEAGLSPAGSDTSGSRVWRVERAQHDSDSGHDGIRPVSLIQAMAWAIAIVLVIPARKTKNADTTVVSGNA